MKRKRVSKADRKALREWNRKYAKPAARRLAEQIDASIYAVYLKFKPTDRDLWWAR